LSDIDTDTLHYLSDPLSDMTHFLSDSDSSTCTVILIHFCPILTLNMLVFARLNIQIFRFSDTFQVFTYSDTRTYIQCFNMLVNKYHNHKIQVQILLAIG
jgi:hypothetical protein